MALHQSVEGKMTVSVITRDVYLFQKIRHELSDFEIVDSEHSGADFCLADIDTAAAPSGALTMSRHKPCDISLPFELGELSLFLFERAGDSKLLHLADGDRAAKIHGKKIKLTEVEYSLLSLLLSAGGEYISREKILEEIWDSEADSGVINVYIHYLREKLEFLGDKVILSSRKLGYCIDKKYIGGGMYAQDN